jgi:hypothetical protein
MTSSTRAKRTVRIIVPLAHRAAGVIQIVSGADVADYHVRRLGDGTFRCRKLDEGAEAYDVTLGAGTYRCACKAWFYRRECRHGSALLALAGRNLL